jgi:hypothetical protein
MALHPLQSATEPWARGPSFDAWLMAELLRHLEEWVATPEGQAACARTRAAIEGRAIATPRDSYGWRGIRGNVATLAPKPQERMP